MTDLYVLEEFIPYEQSDRIMEGTLKEIRDFLLTRTKAQQHYYYIIKEGPEVDDLLKDQSYD